MELASQKTRLQDVMDRVQNKWSCVPTEIQILHNELNVSMQEAKDKVFTIYFYNKCLEHVK